MAVAVSTDNVGALLAVFAALLLDNVVRLEETVGQVTDLVMSGGRPDRELVVTLQSFDRLKQEFGALGEALSRYAEAINAEPVEGKELGQLVQDVVAEITVADLKDRLLHRLRNELPQVGAPKVAELVAPELNVDVIF